MNAITESEFNFPGQLSVYHGKVRDVYTLKNDLVVMVASDRISAFDHVLPKGIPFKGQVLNQVATMFLDATKDIVPNWLLATPDPSVAVGLACEPIRVEMVIRGYLAGHAAREYAAGKRMICGVEMLEGLKENDRFPEPIITPASKAEEGHDEDQDRDQLRDRLPDAGEAQPIEVGLFRHVAVPDHQVLAEADVTEERGEGKAKFTKIPEVIHGDQVVCLQMLPPPHGEQRQRHDHVEPRAHEHDPGVHRLLEVERDAHGVVPRHEAPADHERHTDGDRELPLQ